MSRFHVLALFALSVLHSVQGTYKLCAFPTMDRTSCDLIEEGNSNVSCIRVADSVDCSLKLKDGTADFALYNPNEAVLAGKFIDDYVTIFGESRYANRINDTNSEDFVVVVRKPFSGRFADLQGKSYCHPGVGLSHKLTDKILKSFEDKILARFHPRSDCSRYYSVAEQELRDLEAVFGPSCRPGRWAEDKNVDEALKRRYRNMCRICESSSACSYGLLDKGLQTGALECLAQRGDVAFVSLKSVEAYFGWKGGPASASTDDFVFLCPNETVKAMNSSSGPCVWASQPWNLFVGRKPVSAELQSKLQIWLSNSKKVGSERWQSNLRKLLLKDHRVYVTRRTASILPIAQYVDRGVANTDLSPCKRQIEWCTVSGEEKEKCQWLRGAAQTYGIRPLIGCSHSEGDKWNCLRKLGERKSDLVSIPTDDGIIARRAFSLSTVFFEDNLLNANYKIIAVLRAGSTITSFSDLKNKKACFPEYNGLAWIGFVSLAKQLGLLEKQCPENFFAEGCTPGAYSNEFSSSGKTPPSSLCRLCPSNQYNTIANCSVKFPRRERNLRALQCLDNGGDVAFINLRALHTGSRDSTQVDSSIDQTKYKVLCKNSTIADGTLEVGEDCSLATGVHGEVMGRGIRSAAEEIDDKELLLQLNRWFGRNEETTTSAISMYDAFQNHKGLLFQDGTIYLVDADDESYNSINNYKSLLQNVSKVCPGKSSSVVATPMFGVFFMLFAAIVAIFGN